MKNGESDHTLYLRKWSNDQNFHAFIHQPIGIRLPQHILLKYLCFKAQINFVFAQFVQQLGFDRHLDQSVTNNMDCHLPFKRQ